MLIPYCLLAAVVSSPPQRRALWVWHGGPLVQNATERKKFFQFLAAPKGNPNARISVIFLSRAGLANAQTEKPLEGFVAEAHRRSIRVDYLCGEDYYATPKRMNEGLWQLDYVLRYNRSVAPESRFDGIQFDVEPYALPGWPSNEVLAGYITFLDRCRDRIKRSGQPFAFGVAIPRWFDGDDLHGLYKKVLDRVDYVAVMDYVDKPEAFVNDGANEVAYATQLGKDAWLGAEATRLPDEPNSTFFSLGNAKMEEAFAAATKAFSSSRGFAGVAVEYYETYVALRP